MVRLSHVRPELYRVSLPDGYVGLTVDDAVVVAESLGTLAPLQMDTTG